MIKIRSNNGRSPKNPLFSWKFFHSPQDFCEIWENERWNSGQIRRFSGWFRGVLRGLDLVWKSATPPTHIWERSPKKKRFFFWQLPLLRLSVLSFLELWLSSALSFAQLVFRISSPSLMERKSRPNCGINDCVMRRVSGSTTHQPGFTSACSRRFFLLFFVLSFLLNNIVHDFTRSKCSRSVYWYIQGFPLVPLELTSDSRDILAERRYLSTKSQSASTAFWMSALYRQENI